MGTYGVTPTATRHAAHETSVGSLYVPEEGYVPLVPGTNIIGELGVSFGFHLAPFTADDTMQKLDMQILTVTPGILSPTTGQLRRQEIYSFTHDPTRPVWCVFTFEEPWEIATGEWKMQLRFRNVVLHEEVFSVSNRRETEEDLHQRR